MTFCGKSSSPGRVPCPTMRHGARFSDPFKPVTQRDVSDPSADRPSAAPTHRGCPAARWLAGAWLAADSLPCRPAEPRNFLIAMHLHYN